MSDVIISYKGFDKDLKCRGFQYEIGKEYEEEKAYCCHSGFHAVEMPLHVFNHYAPGEMSRYCVVEQSGEIDREDNSEDSKLASTKIKIGAEIGIPDLVKAQIEWVKEKIGYDDAIKRAKESPSESATGRYGAASATGDQGAASATGRYGAASATGYQGAASATGVGCTAIATGYKGKVKGAIGNALYCNERGEWNGETFPLLSVACGIVDGVTLKEDTWYTAKDGKLIECK